MDLLDFVDRLKLRKEKRIVLDTILEEFIGSRPELRSAPDLRHRLRQVLDDAEQNGDLQLPGKAWDRTGHPPLPRWVQLREVPVPHREEPAYAWLPQLAFAAEARHPNQREYLRQINEFLKSRRGQPLISIPVKERSLQIFKDEKRLDSIRTGSSLFGGALTLADLGCHLVDPPLPVRGPAPAAPHQPLLVVENHESYHSFVRWNAVSRAYAAVAYGGGNAFCRSCTQIDGLLEEYQADGAFYLGDVDPEGIRILSRANSICREHGFSLLKPAVWLYRWLVFNGIRRSLAKVPGADHEKEVAALFDQELAAAIKALWETHWIPQESLSYEHLIGTPGAFFPDALPSLTL